MVAEFFYSSFNFDKRFCVVRNGFTDVGAQIGVCFPVDFTESLLALLFFKGDTIFQKFSSSKLIKNSLGGGISSSF